MLARNPTSRVHGGYTFWDWRALAGTRDVRRRCADTPRRDDPARSMETSRPCAGSRECGLIGPESTPLELRHDEAPRVARCAVDRNRPFPRPAWPAWVQAGT